MLHVYYKNDVPKIVQAIKSNMPNMKSPNLSQSPKKSLHLLDQDASGCILSTTGQLWGPQIQNSVDVLSVELLKIYVAGEQNGSGNFTAESLHPLHAWVFRLGDALLLSRHINLIVSMDGDGDILLLDSWKIHLNVNKLLGLADIHGQARGQLRQAWERIHLALPSVER